MAERTRRFAADGVRTAPVFVTQVVDAQRHRPLASDTKRASRVLDRDIARDGQPGARAGRDARHRRQRARIGRPVAGKTGTERATTKTPGSSARHRSSRPRCGSASPRRRARWCRRRTRDQGDRRHVARRRSGPSSWAPNSRETPIADFPAPAAGAANGVLPTRRSPTSSGCRRRGATAAHRQRIPVAPSTAEPRLPAGHRRRRRSPEAHTAVDVRPPSSPSTSRPAATATTHGADAARPRRRPTAQHAATLRVGSTSASSRPRATARIARRGAAGCGSNRRIGRGCRPRHDRDRLGQPRHG